LSKERVAMNVQYSGEADVQGTQTRNALIVWEMIEQLRDDYTELDFDDLNCVLNALQPPNPLSPVYDVETESRRVLTNLLRRKHEIKA
jgi:hypothetical protein